MPPGAGNSSKSTPAPQKVARPWAQPSVPARAEGSGHTGPIQTGRVGLGAGVTHSTHQQAQPFPQIGLPVMERPSPGPPGTKHSGPAMALAI